MTTQTDSIQENVLNGVIYADIRHNTEWWRVGSVVPDYQTELLAVGASPTDQDIERLRREGIFLGKNDPRPLAVLCEGMGAVWPHMGRELYEEFRDAREAMDRIQAIASWDVLSLMDEDDPDVINQTRWQIPYLFLLEYAEWCTLSSLGLRPAMLCGHSLGELIALCCAGIYNYEVAFYILDKRAEYVADLEAHAGKNFGMLAVHASYDVVEKVLQEHEDVRVANYNTPKQFILGASKETLQGIRKELRKSRIPAVGIPVSLLFHHPQMRILRNISLTRLNALEMHSPRIPVMGVANCGLYPRGQKEICTTIADLDENPVRFAECVQKMWHEYGIQRFVEIGPQDILCGLVTENAPSAEVMACNHKGHEARSMRLLLSRLYAEGALDSSKIREAIESSPKKFFLGRGEEEPSEPKGENPVFSKEEKMRQLLGDDEPLCAMLEKIADFTGIPKEELYADLDLRHDLHLRSSSFPWLILQAEKILHTELSFESLLSVSTLGDFFRVIKGLPPEKEKETEKSLLPRPKPVVSHIIDSDGILTLHPAPCSPSDFPIKSILLYPAYPLQKNSLFLDLFDSLWPGLEAVYVPDDEMLLLLRDHSEIFRPGDAAECAVHVSEGSSDPSQLQNIAASIKDSPSLLVFIRVWHEKDLACRAFLDETLLLSLSSRSSCSRLLLIEYVPSDHQEAQDLGALLAKSLLGDSRHELWGVHEELEKSLQKLISTRMKWHGLFDIEGKLETVPKAPPPCGRLQGCFPFQIVPDRMEMAEASPRLFQGNVFFSRCLDSVLANPPHFPLRRLFEALTLAGEALVPWMSLQGFSDVSLGILPESCEPLLFEGDISVKSLASIRMETVSTRQCQGEIRLFATKASCRHGDKMRCLRGTLLLALEKLPMLREDIAFSRDKGTDEIFSGEAAEIFQDMALSPIHLTRLATDLFFLQLRFEKSLGGREETMLLIEASIRATKLFLEKRKDASPSLRLRPVQIGYVRFGEKAQTDECAIFIQRTWQNTQIERFDVDVNDLHGTKLLSLTHLEWRLSNESSAPFC